MSFLNLMVHRGPTKVCFLQNSMITWIPSDPLDMGGAVYPPLCP